MTRETFDRLLELLPSLTAPAVVEGGFLDDFQDGLFEAEKFLVASAVDKRRREFTAGRCAARKAMQTLGIPPCVIMRGANGEPLWPEGIVGSLSHSESLCFALCAKKEKIRAAGIDTERIGRMERNLWRIVFSEDDQGAIEAMPDKAMAATVAFSAKEAFFKAQYSISNRMLEFKSMRVNFESPGEITIYRDSNDMSFAAVPQANQLRYLAIDDHVVVTCIIF